ncbi:molybdopterin molybdotransferase MoeA [Alphaproteobacteria bacterium]|nr:molybdopterin molybdotransferase MoeA [Alphaproteobacteria bacterium]
MPKSNLLSLDDAIEKVKLNFNQISSEDVFLENALGRCLAEPVISKLDNPQYDVSSMDGYAINYKSYLKIKNQINKKFKIVGESSAGTPFNKKVNEFETVRIFTGSKIPSGCNTVIIQEDVTISKDKNFIVLNAELTENQHVRTKGLDLEKNKKVYDKGTIIRARHLGSIAMTGQVWLNVTRKPIISILSTGNEISKVGEQLSKDQIPSGNNLMIAAMIKEFGGLPRILPIANDNFLHIYNTLKNALDSDLIVTTGGVSVGKYDLIQKALLKFKNNKINFWKIAMRPGKPLLFTHIENTPVIGLPGNPVSSGVCCMIFVNIAIRKMLGLNNDFPMYDQAILEGELGPNDHRFDFVRSNLINDNGVVKVKPIKKQDSSMITNFSQSDCLIARKPDDISKNEGDKVDILKYPNNI